MWVRGCMEPSLAASGLLLKHKQVTYSSHCLLLMATYYITLFPELNKKFF